MYTSKTPKSVQLPALLRRLNTGKICTALATTFNSMEFVLIASVLIDLQNQGSIIAGKKKRQIKKGAPAVNTKALDKGNKKKKPAPKKRKIDKK